MVSDDVCSVRLVVEVTRYGDPVAALAAGVDGMSWHAAVYDPTDHDDAPPVAEGWSDVGPDQAVSNAFEQITLTGVLSDDNN